MSNSFYGGRDGQSFVIKQSFINFESMIAAFQNSDNTTVGFGEYVILDYENKNHPMNGRIYRRGYDYNNSARQIQIYEWDSAELAWKENTTSAYGAIYIGSIVGPAGGAPNIQIVEYDEAQEKPENADFSQVGDGSGVVALVPGTESNDIKFQYCVFRNVKTNNDTIMKIGFQAPYPVFNVSAKSVSAYTTDSLINYEQEKNFVHNFDFSIPKGIKGDTVQNLRVLNSAPQGQTIYKNDSTVYNGKYPIFAIDIINYDDNEEGNTVTYYIGDYDVIESVSLINGLLKIVMADGTVAVNQQMDWINSAILNSQNQLTIDMENSSDISVNLKCPNEIYYQKTEDDTTTGIYVKYNTEEESFLGPYNAPTSATAATIDEIETIGEKVETGGIIIITEEVEV